MDLHELASKARAARQTTITLGPSDAPRTFTLLAPTDHQVQVAALRAGMSFASTPAQNSAADVISRRAMLCDAIIGWTGVTCADLAGALKHGGAEPFEWQGGASELLLDNRPEWADQLWLALASAITRLRTERDTAAKNLHAASPGNDPEPVRQS